MLWNLGNFNDCSQNKRFRACPDSVLDTTVSCLQRNNVTCRSYATQCRNYYAYVMTQKGVLMRDNKENDIFTVDLKGWTNPIKKSSHSIAYINWQDNDAVQIGETKLISPVIKLPPVEVTYFNISENFVHSISMASIIDAFNDASEKYTKPQESFP